MSVQNPNFSHGTGQPGAKANSPGEIAFKGIHVMADLYGIDFNALNEQSTIAGVLERAIPKGGATLLGIQLKQFEPHGVTALALLSESHVSIHTYPEKGSAFLDVFTCGDCDPEVIAEEIAAQLGTTLQDVRRVDRGASNQILAAVNSQDTETSGPSDVVVESIAPGISRSWDIEEIHAHARTQYQDVLIGRTAQGLSLFCEEERQSTELSQLIYHEGQIIPAALMADTIDNVLVIGSSEGVISQIAVALGASSVTHVDIDEACVRLCAEFLPYGYSPEDLKRGLSGSGPIEILFQDAFGYVDTCVEAKRKFDIIVMDLPDEQLTDAQQNRLYEETFLKKLSSVLTPQGAFITQAGSTTYWRNETLVRTMRRMRKIFPTTVFFEMEEQDWAWVVGANLMEDNVTERMTSRLGRLSYQPNFIDADSIKKATIIPISIRKQLAE